MINLFDTGIRPAIDEYLAAKQAEVRSYGEYWSASSAGYCQRKLIFERLGVPPVEKQDDARKQRVFESGHIFHEWAQRITKESGLSIAQELEVQDEELMVRGHIDDLVYIPFTTVHDTTNAAQGKLILYDYKTQHSNAFTWQKGRPPSYFHRMQVGTYMYMLRNNLSLLWAVGPNVRKVAENAQLEEARILKISKDDLRMDENQILYDEKLEKEVLDYWNTLNGYWQAKKLPPCSCAAHENGFMAKEKFNPYFFNGEPCSLELYNNWKESK